MSDYRTLQEKMSELRTMLQAAEQALEHGPTVTTHARLRALSLGAARMAELVRVEQLKRMYDELFHVSAKMGDWVNQLG